MYSRCLIVDLCLLQEHTCALIYSKHYSHSSLDMDYSCDFTTIVTLGAHILHDIRMLPGKIVCIMILQGLTQWGRLLEHDQV